MAEAKDDETIAVDEKGEEVPTEPETAEQPADSPGGPSRWRRFKTWYKSHKPLSIPLTILVLLLLLLIIPPTRYALAGSVYKKNYTVAVYDAVTHTPVSGATVSTSGVSSQTGGDGKAVLHVSVGPHSFTITKNNYGNGGLNSIVPLFGQNVPNVDLTATGRQVKISVTNLFNHQPLAGVNIKLPDGQAQTDSAGTALTVVPEATKSAKVLLSLDGYTDNEVTIQADDSIIKQNDVTLTPAGKLYFLSKLSGKIDVVKTDLDGKHRKTVLAGTGKEQESNTVLLASRDWKYLALLSRRDTPQPKLYLIDTSSDSVTTLDQGDATFTPIGWDEHYFLYEIERNNVKPYASGTASIKGFNADSRQITLLDNTNGVGSSLNHYAHERYDYYYAGRNNFYILNHNLVYSKSWDWNYEDATSSALLAGKQNTIHQINVSGSGHRVLLSYDVDKYLESFLNDPQTIDYQVEGGKNKYYEYVNSTISENAELKDTWDKYYDTQVTNTYLLSPSGNRLFWYEDLDGKNALRVADTNLQHKVSAGRSKDFVPYGWYTDNYLLVSKDQSELYIFPSSGLSPTVKAYHVTDYHKPARSFYGYGGGYGGL